jgi:hypothetical protein
MVCMAKLIVVLGAGASYDCASTNVNPDLSMRPPLVKDLFDTRFQDILHEYPLAEQVAPDVRVALQGGAIALEAFLREELRDSPYPHLRSSYLALPLYLQHLFWQVGDSYALQPDNYDRLVMECLRLDRVTFMTLNYDTILDRRLAIRDPLASFDDYVKPGRSWGLVKLHGSINWGRPIIGTAVPGESIGFPVTWVETQSLINI